MKILLRWFFWTLVAAGLWEIHNHSVWVAAMIAALIVVYIEGER